MPVKGGLTSKRLEYKPFRYAWAYDAYIQSERMHWLPTEVPMAEDLKDWKYKLSEGEKRLVTSVLRFFVQGDIDIANAYIKNYLPAFGGQPEVAMMLSSFAAREATHIDGYAYLNESLGLPDSIYREFLDYEEMRDKHNYTDQFIGASPDKIAQQIAVFSGFNEGVQLFGSFACLLNFSRFGKLKGLSQIVSWAVQDESHHSESMIKLFRTFISENLDIWNDELKQQIYESCRKMVALEEKFIDLIFDIDELQDLTKEEVKQYIRYLADRRLISLGMKTEYGVKKNPLPWLEGLLGISHGNFFEQKVTDYSKGALTGDWGDIWL